MLINDLIALIFRVPDYDKLLKKYEDEIEFNVEFVEILINLFIKNLPSIIDLNSLVAKEIRVKFYLLLE